jgi:hypothetical protein
VRTIWNPGANTGVQFQDIVPGNCFALPMEGDPSRPSTNYVYIKGTRDGLALHTSGVVAEFTADRRVLPLVTELVIKGVGSAQ